MGRKENSLPNRDQQKTARGIISKAKNRKDNRSPVLVGGQSNDNSGMARRGCNVGSGCGG